MELISSDTNVWIDFEVINHLDYPFKLNCKFLMNSDAINDELIYPYNFGERLIKYGLISTELT